MNKIINLPHTHLYRILYNNKVSAVFGFNPIKKVWFSFENTESVRAKMIYVKCNNLAGLMLWNIKEDYPATDPNSLLATIFNVNLQKTNCS